MAAELAAAIDDRHDVLPSLKAPTSHEPVTDNRHSPKGMNSKGSVIDVYIYIYLYDTLFNTDGAKCLTLYSFDGIFIGIGILKPCLRLNRVAAGVSSV